MSTMRILLDDTDMEDLVDGREVCCQINDILDYSDLKSVVIEHCDKPIRTDNTSCANTITLEDWRELFSNKVKELMTANNINQRQLAKKIDLSYVTLNRLLNCKRSPHPTYIIRMAKVFNCTTDELINFDKIVDLKNRGVE